MRRFLLLVSALSISAAAFATDYPPQDHGGANLTLANGDVIWGEHRNVGNFTVPQGATVSVRPYVPSVASTGEFSVFADEIVVDGTLTADGAGYTGGGGRGALGSMGSPGNDSGTPGQAGHPRYTEYAGAQSLPNDGDGPFGGTADVSDQAARNGGYDSADNNSDTSEDTVVLIGSGGAGGFDTAPVEAPEGECEINSEGGSGGSGGGPGGGSVALYARDSITISGVILTTGTFGQRGAFGQVATVEKLVLQCNARGGNGGNGGDGERSQLVVNGGGAGAGGGCVLFCLNPGQTTITGTIDARGGEWRKGDPADGIQNGGSVKLFFTGSNDLTGTIAGGRTFFKNAGDGTFSPTLPLLGSTTSTDGFDQNFDGIIDAADINASTTR